MDAAVERRHAEDPIVGRQSQGQDAGLKDPALRSNLSKGAGLKNPALRSSLYTKPKNNTGAVSVRLLV